MIRTFIFITALSFTSIVSAASSTRLSQTTLLRGAAGYRQCYYCDSLMPMKKAAPVWDEVSLKKWLSDSNSMVPGSSMTMKGIKDKRALDSLVEFLKITMQAGGFENVLRRNILKRTKHFL